MSIIRVVKRNRYSIIDNTPIKDKNLSAEALGVLTYLLSKPNDWRARKTEVLNRFSKNKRNRIDTAFKELIDNKYAKLSAIQGEKGKLIGREYTIYEQPTVSEELPMTEKSDVGKTPSSEISDVEEIPPLVNTDSLPSTDKDNNKQKPLSSSENKDDLVCPQCGFNEFTFYPEENSVCCRDCEYYDNEVVFINQQSQEETKGSSARCPRCGNELIHTGQCLVCQKCGSVQMASQSSQEKTASDKPPIPKNGDSQKSGRKGEIASTKPLSSGSSDGVKKQKYAEFVWMTQDEYEKLYTKHGGDFTKKSIEKLDNYKGSKGKKYKSDYRAILSWVVDEVKKQQPKKRRTMTEKIAAGEVKI